MLPTSRFAPLASFFLCAAMAVLPACASETEAPGDTSSAAASTDEAEDTPEDVASVTAAASEHGIARAVLGITKLRDENGKKRVFTEVRYLDDAGEVIARGIPHANATGGFELALVRVGETGGSADADVQLTADARAITARLLAEVDAHGCSLGKGVVRAVGRFVGGLVIGAAGLVVLAAILPVALYVAQSPDGETSSVAPFVNKALSPLVKGINLVRGSFKPCREVPKD